ncbi:twin-arginine translocase TatA/TatE family subunit [Thalassoglobus sp. JC818]|uniref:twin-arginine translocase TatA/TatE family subunit n=1 Tax=Thalassoglobus sp. JC818 TaxID=3232136 RepID=UPI003459998B
MFGFGTAELVLFLFVGLLLFGHRLPSTMKSVGQSFRSFRQGIQDEECSVK